MLLGREWHSRFQTKVMLISSYIGNIQSMSEPNVSKYIRYEFNSSSIFMFLVHIKWYDR